MAKSTVINAGEELDDIEIATGEETEKSFRDIDILQEAGVNVVDIKKLKDHGIFTVNALFQMMRKEMVSIKGMSDGKIDKILEAARKVLPNAAGYVTGIEMDQRLKDRVRLVTGSMKLNSLLGGGVESHMITELIGEYRSGKTQLCHTLAVVAQLPRENGGGNGRVIYIDTENTFRPDRIRQIAAAYHVDPHIVLQNIIVGRCYTSEHMDFLLSSASLEASRDRFSLIIIDSIMAPFRVDYSGRGDLAERQQKLGRILSRTQKFIEEYGMACVITNHVMADPGAVMSFGPAPAKAIGGHIIAHFSQVRLMLRKGRGEQRICRIHDSPSLPEGEAIFAIGERGVEDAAE